MSGGFIKLQKKGGHQVIFFTLVGEINQHDVDDWNNAILALKHRFPDKLTGVTIPGDPTPRKYMVPKKK